MRSYMLSSLLVAVVCVLSPVRAQEQSEDNVQYEKLKVLEPIIGTWSAVWTNEETGGQNEMQTTYSWAPGNRMIVSINRRRAAGAGETLAAQKWDDGGLRISYVWNSKTETIEQHNLFTEIGVAVIHSVMPKGDGGFELKIVHSTADWGTYDNTMTVTNDEWKQRLFNRKSSDGESSDDIEVLMKRVK